MAETERLRDAFDAEVDVAGPPRETVGYFLVERREGASNEAFLGAIEGVVGGPDAIVLSADRLVVVLTSYGAAQSLRSHSTVGLVGGVRVDIERLRAVLAGDV